MKGKSNLSAPRSLRRFCTHAAVALGVFALSATARAEYVQCEIPFTAGAPLQSLVQGAPHSGSSFNNTQLVWGTSLNVNSLSLGSAGRLNVSLKDIGWPEALESLTLLVTDLDGMWQRLDGTGSLLIDVSGPTQLFAAVFARSADRSLGLYNVNASFAPVPLPAAAWLLASALAGLGLMRRRPAAGV